MKKMISMSVIALFFSLLVIAEKTSEEHTDPFEKCLSFDHIQELRVKRFNKKTYYTFRYYNLCTTDIKICWDCEDSGPGCPVCHNFKNSNDVIVRNSLS